MTQPACPDSEAIRQLLLGPLAGWKSFEEHLRHCEHCLQQTEAVASRDTVVESLRSSRAWEGDEEVLAEAIKRSKQLHPKLAADGAAAESADVRQRLDRIADEFESAWRTGSRPKLAAFLDQHAEVDRRRLLMELLAIEIEIRRAAGETPRPEDYSAEFPDQSSVLCEAFAADQTVALASPAEETSSFSRPQQPVAALAQNLRDEIDFLAPPQQPDEIGRLGDYRVLEVMGVGGMGVVFRAEDPHLQRLVALKAMKPAVAASRSARDRFFREARAAAALDHDHIVSIYQVGEDRTIPYIAMQYLRGESLQTRLKREGSLEEADVVEIGREVALGLAAAHEKGLIHRDIKPDNIWIEAGTGRAKILDFGLARAHNDDSGLTQSGMVIGTPRYMAPEQAQAAEVDSRCDLFSLGSVLYHLASGKAPFDGGSLTATLIAVAHKPEQPIAEVRSTLHPSFCKLVRELLEKDPADRPQSAQEVADTLAAIKEVLTAGAPQSMKAGPPTPKLARQGAPAGSARKSSGSKRVWLAGLGLLALAGLLAAGIVLNLKTPAGMIVLEIDDPNAIGSVVTIDGDKQITIKTADSPVPIEVTADEKTHTLKVAKGGFETFTKQFSVKSGEKETIRVRLEALTAIPRPASPAAPILATQTGELPRYDPSPPPKLGTWEPFGPVAVQQMFPDKKIAGAKTLPGLALTPARIPGIKRWNVTTYWPHDLPHPLAYSHDGKLLAMGSSDGTRIYDAEKFTLLQIIPSTFVRKQSLSWRPDGKRLMIDGACWSSDGRPEANDHTPPGVSADVSVYSPDSTLVVSGRDKQLYLHGLGSDEFKTIALESKLAGAPAWSPDSERFATVHDSQELRIWNRLGELQSTVLGLGPLNFGKAYIQWSPDGKWIGLADGIQGVVHRVGVDGKQGEPMKLGGYPVSLFSWSADGERAHHSAAVSLDGTRMVSRAGDVLTFYGRDLTVLRRIDRSRISFEGLTWNPKGDTFISGSDRFDLWSSTGEHLAALEKAGGWYQRIEYQPGGELVAMCGPAGVDGVLLGNPEKGFQQIVPGGYRSLSWSADGKYLAAGVHSDVLEIYDQTGEKTAEIQGAEGSAIIGFFAPDKQLLLVHDFKQEMLQFCSPATDWKLRPIEGLEKNCGWPCWSPDGQFLFVKTLGLFKYEMDGRFTRFSTALSSIPADNALRWTPDGKEIITSYDTWLTKFEAADGRRIRSLSFNGDRSTGLSHHPTRNLFTTCHPNSTLITWNGETMEPYWRTVMLPGRKAITLTAAGQILHGDHDVVDEHLMYYYETDDGRIETVSPSEFEKLIGQSIYVPAAEE
ncbi:WD40 repeat domain-containing serine/threonine protein kinase [Lignipirellula cremea]|uniref:non-specific serine/threonine protein kinase n=1 Tax=Lignipirellula cremea TaxID=2528010 RepID=A0A518DQB9_9BACT|nr:WD40 repeat domain-containing serine/threonine-protein kinase [Lignipirellula cremea]QDU94037.1 Serine/threonine-protein kinase PknB [Lignipirellula cremea]